MRDSELALKSIRYRKQVLTYIYMAKAGHTGGSLSCIDILNVLYNRILNVSPGNFFDPDRNRYVHSKGHSVESLYVVLSDLGFFPEKALESLGAYKSDFIGHPTNKIPGIEHNTGALGHGLSFSAGLALAGKMDGRPYKVYTLLGDGELAEGSNWEAALAAAHHGLDNVCAIIDYNKLQITGPTSTVCRTDPVDKKFESFGWMVRHVDGHDLAQLTGALRKLPIRTGQPSLVIAHTIKGKGVSFMENNIAWHHCVPTGDQFSLAMKELDDAESLIIKSL